MMLQMPPQDPTLENITKDLIPELPKWEVGKKYKLEIEAELTEISKEESGEICGEFLVKKINPLGEKSKLAELSKRYD